MLAPRQGGKTSCRVVVSGGVVDDAPQPPATGSRYFRHRFDQKGPFMTAKSLVAVRGEVSGFLGPCR